VFKQHRGIVCQYFGAFVCPTKLEKLTDTQGSSESPVSTDSVCFISCGELKLPIRENTPCNFSPAILSGYADTSSAIASVFCEGQQLKVQSISYQAIALQCELTERQVSGVLRHIARFLQQFNKDSLKGSFGILVNLGVGYLKIKDGTVRFTQQRSTLLSVAPDLRTDA